MKKRILSLLPLALVLAVVLCTPVFALTETEVEAQVAATSKEAVTGNVLIWFLCAVAFLKDIQNAFKHFEPQKIRRMYIDKPGKAEKRPLGIPTIRDRIAQECMRISGRSHV